MAKRKASASMAALFPSRTELTIPTSVRFSATLLKRVDALAAAKEVTRTEVIEKMVAWALDALDPQAIETLDELQTRRRRAGALSGRR